MNNMFQNIWTKFPSRILLIHQWRLLMNLSKKYYFRENVHASLGLVPCHAMSCHITSCHAMPYHTTLRHAMLCHATLCENWKRKFINPSIIKKKYRNNGIIFLQSFNQEQYTYTATTRLQLSISITSGWINYQINKYITLH